MSGQGGLTILGGFALVQNTILGPGLVGLPWAVAQCGMVPGMIIMVLSALTSLLGMHCLAATAAKVAPALKDHPRGLTLNTICQHVNAKVLQVTFDVGLVIGILGAIISSVMIAGDSLAQNLPGLTRNQWILLVFFIVAGPLSFFKKLEFLRFSSSLSLATCMYIACLVGSAPFRGDFPQEEIGNFQANRFGENDLSILQAIPIFIYCMCGHPSVISVANELQNLTTARMDTVLAMSVAAACIISGSISWGAYSTFGDATPKDVLSFFPESIFSSIARIGITVVCVAFYPLLVNPLRAVVLGWVASSSPATKSEGLLGGDGAPAKEFARISDAWHWVITAVIGAISLGTALSTTNLGQVFSLSGATGFALICHVCPAALFLKVVTDASKPMRILAGCLQVFGILVIPVCVTANLV